MTNNQKPKSPLIGADGNIFNLVGVDSRTLKENNMSKEASEMSARVFESNSYEEALNIITEYVEPVEVDFKQEEVSYDMEFKE
ncbi:hypothetical protein G7061_08445 [Erysipelothrix sp. HDW6B]|uniref:hypothetical protein n=1 Tax=Erysipelothrix sp. HDW6B TaxID=2714929 RepID=UPI001409442E|nr:hypothetical protein [Erysipelothrix sp. HDW6B]QIK86637.1 hypothetical protein G7061_08445 [Erysipelothrix sp. HDW6B]